METGRTSERCRTDNTLLLVFKLVHNGLYTAAAATLTWIPESQAPRLFEETAGMAWLYYRNDSESFSI